MKLPVINTQAQEVKKIELPAQFAEPLREDIIQRAVVACQTNARQPYGAKPGAGMRASSEISKRRRDFKGCYGHGISRMPRKALSGRGTRFSWVGATAPGTVGGRQAHPPKSWKIWNDKMNDLERLKAIRSALSAVLNKTLVEKRGHIIPEKYPFILDNSFENLEKTKELKKVLEAIGFKDELSRTLTKKVSIGKAKIRGRKRKTGKSILFIVSKQCSLMRSAKNLIGIDVLPVNNISAEDLAPGCTVGRVTLITEDAIEHIKKEMLFTKIKTKKIGKKARAKKPLTIEKAEKNNKKPQKAPNARVN
ncbi:MAG: 50S ribosomal protein L4 [Candidatus Woesearchaeota archaeon]